MLAVGLAEMTTAAEATFANGSNPASSAAAPMPLLL
jgi:hypothetical protein